MLDGDSAKGDPLISTLSVPGTTWQWPADVLAFAAEHQVADYLAPLLQATRGLFPTASSLRVFLEDDPGIRDDWHIVLEVEVHKADVPDYLEAKHRWIAELVRLCPAPLAPTFRLTLLRTAR